MNEGLLIRYLTKTCTQEEIHEVEKWISNDQTNADWLFGMESVWYLKEELRYSERKEIEVAYRRFINTRQPSGQKQTKSLRGWVKYAAAIVIVCLLATNIYQAFRNKPSERITENIIEVPVGQRVAITLADGTKVWLNSSSILSYPTKFDSNNRNVRLDGEGYFEVTADEEHPFIVNTEILDVKALGTKFNIQAYPDDDIAVSLIEGQLYVQAGAQSAMMKTNELVTWSESKGLVHYKNKKIEHAAQWTTGELMFVDERLADIAKALERHFGVTIIITKPELANETFTCRTHPEPTLEQVLNMLKGTKKLNYSFKGKTVNLY